MLTDVAIINSTAIKAFVQVQKPRLLHKQTLVHRQSQSNYNELKMAKQRRARQAAVNKTNRQRQKEAKEQQETT